MYCLKFFTAGQKIKTAAALSAVVFLFCIGGCCASNTPGAEKSDQSGLSSKGIKRLHRKRVGEYSRIPGNYPAGWQTMTVGN